jgi:hypothetical protein
MTENIHQKRCEETEKRRLMQHEKDLQLFRHVLAGTLTHLAVDHGYVLTTGGNPWMHGLHKKGVQIYVYHSHDSVRTNRYTVTTQIKHPKKGRTQLHRRYCTLEDIIKILENPRVHTSKGYYKKKNLLGNL